MLNFFNSILQFFPVLIARGSRAYCFYSGYITIMHMFFSSDVIRPGRVLRSKTLSSYWRMFIRCSQKFTFSFGSHYISVDFTVGQIVNPALIYRKYHYEFFSHKLLRLL